MSPMKPARRPPMHGPLLPEHIRQKKKTQTQVLQGLTCLDAEGELDANVDLAGHLDDLGELDGLLGGVLEVLDGEDLQAGLVDLEGGC